MVQSPQERSFAFFATFCESRSVLSFRDRRSGWLWFVFSQKDAKIAKYGMVRPAR